MSAKRCFQVDPTTSTLAKRHNGEINLRQFHRNEASQRFEDETRLKIANDIIGSPEDEESDLLAIIKMGSTTKAVGEVASSLQSQLHNLTTTMCSNVKLTCGTRISAEAPADGAAHGTIFPILPSTFPCSDSVNGITFILSSTATVQHFALAIAHIVRSSLTAGFAETNLCSQTRPPSQLEYRH